MQLAETYEYIPTAALDMWAVGLLLLVLLGGSKPQEHEDAIATEDESQILAYLRGLATAAIPYCFQVTPLPTPHSLHAAQHSAVEACLCE